MTRGNNLGLMRRNRCGNKNIHTSLQGMRRNGTCRNRSSSKGHGLCRRDGSCHSI